MAATIEEFARERGIKRLLHFTQSRNLGSILKRGLVTRDTLRQEGNDEIFNDLLRLDLTPAVCTSIEFPNYKMFWGLRQDHKDIEWVILVINAAVLWSERCAFCQTNAASKEVTNVPLETRMSVAALELMYADFGNKQRSALEIPSSYPTNPQAEVLVLDGVPRKYIAGVLALTENSKNRLEAAHPGSKVRLKPGYFGHRTDYTHWK